MTSKKSFEKHVFQYGIPHSPKGDLGFSFLIKGGGINL